MDPARSYFEKLPGRIPLLGAAQGGMTLEGVQKLTCFSRPRNWGLIVSEAPSRTIRKRRSKNEETIAKRELKAYFSSPLDMYVSACSAPSF